MADALCGPSNPLQTFQKATSVDRTLQQDRLRPHLPPSAAQGFRSTDPRAGSLDAEFAAFEAGQPFEQSLQQPPPHAQLFSPPPSQQNGIQQDAGSASWATDFQRLRLGGSAPVPQAQFRSEAPMHRSTPAAGWHTEFMKHQQPSVAGGGTSTIPITQGPYQPNSLSNGFPTFSPLMGHDFYQGQVPSSPIQYSRRQQQYQGSQIHSETLDETAFEAAFAEAASADLQATSFTTDQINLQQPQQTTVEPSTYEPPPVQLSSLPKIGSDLIPPKEQLNQEQQQSLNPNIDADSLAQTAGELLHSVRDDSSEKFRQSNFLALMRRLRDREVVVRGDDIVESQSQSQFQSQPPNTSTTANTTISEGDNDSLWTDQTGASTLVSPLPLSKSEDSPSPDSSTLHPGGPSYPYPSSPPLVPNTAAGGEREEHFLDTRPMARGGLEGAGGI